MIDRLRLIVLGLPLILLNSHSMFAQAEITWRETIWQDDFTVFDATQYFLGTDTYYDAAAQNIVLTPEAEEQAGRLFLPQLLPIEYCDVSFRARFGYSESGNNYGADGIVFVMGALYDYAESGGGTLNFDGCLGYGVEFDTYENPERFDSYPEHIAVLKDRSDNHLHWETLRLPTLEDSGWHTILIRFRNGRVDVFLDGISRLNYSIGGFFPFDGFYGFTAATGSSFNEHRLDNINLSLPTRTVMDFGTVSLCEPFLLDTALFVRNNHPDNEAMTITNIRLLTASPNIFQLPNPPIPSVIPPGGRVRIPISVAVTQEGRYTAILELQSDNGERILDTLRITGALPKLAWSPVVQDFGFVQIGDTAQIQASILNIGEVPVTLTSLWWSYGGRNGLFSFTAASLPQLLQPGDSLPVTIQFLPDHIGDSWDSLYVDTDCAVRAGTRVSGTGEDERVSVSITPWVLMSPGESAEIVVYLDSLPQRYPVDYIEGTFAIDSSFLHFDGFEGNVDVLSASGDLRVAFLGDVANFSIERPTPFDRTGALFAMRLLAVAQGPECREVRVDRLSVRNGGVNDASIGEVCINPSCRHPRGLYAIAVPKLMVYPHPVHESSHVTIALLQEEQIRMQVVDLLGNPLRTLCSATLDSGEHRFPFSATGLPDGVYFVRVEWSGGVVDERFVVSR